MQSVVVTHATCGAATRNVSLTGCVVTVNCCSAEYFVSVLLTLYKPFEEGSALYKPFEEGRYSIVLCCCCAGRLR